MNPWRDLKGLPRGVWVLFFATLVNRAGTMALPFLVLYLTRLGYPASRAGLMLTVYGVSALLTAPLAGRLADRFGSLVVMEASLVSSGVVLFAFPAAGGAWIPVMVALLAVTTESFRPANLSSISELVAPERRKAAFALHRLAVNVGMSIGPALGGLLATVSFPALFRVDGATSVLAAALLTLFFRRKNKQAGATAAETASATQNEGATTHAGGSFLRRQFGAFADPRLAYFLLSSMPLLLILFQNESVMALFLVRDLGMSEAGYGAMFTINTALIILLEVPLNSATAHWSHRRALSLGSLLFAVGFGSYGLATNAWGVAACVVVWTFGEMIMFPASSAYVADIAPPHKRGEYMGLYTMSFSLAFAVGPWLGTSVYERHGSRVVWAGALILGLLSAALLARVRAAGGGASGGT
ncbi:MAG TPA: MFS transporter [Pyrinomonadaceae bacterium]|nr:MFS transporter [Pyrinomonadaceae bacterium]